MKFETFTVTKEDGTVVEGKIAVPEDLKELIKIYSEERVYKRGLEEYLNKCKKRLLSVRSKKVVIRVNDLNYEQEEGLRKLGLLKW